MRWVSIYPSDTKSNKYLTLYYDNGLQYFLIWTKTLPLCCRFQSFCGWWWCLGGSDLVPLTSSEQSTPTRIRLAWRNICTQNQGGQQHLSKCQKMDQQPGNCFWHSKKGKICLLQKKQITGVRDIFLNLQHLDHHGHQAKLSSRSRRWRKIAWLSLSVFTTICKKTNEQ